MPKQLTSPYPAADDVRTATPGTKLYVNLGAGRLTTAPVAAHYAGELVRVNEDGTVLLSAPSLAELAQQNAPAPAPDLEDAFAARPKDGNWFCWDCSKGRHIFVGALAAPGRRQCEACQKPFDPAALVSVSDEGYDVIKNSVQLLPGGVIVRNALDNRGNPLIMTDDPATKVRTIVSLRGTFTEPLP